MAVQRTDLGRRAMFCESYVTDTGLVAHLAGMTLRRLRASGVPVGPLMENFILEELARQARGSRSRCGFTETVRAERLPRCPASGFTAW